MADHSTGQYYDFAAAFAAQREREVVADEQAEALITEAYAILEEVHGPNAAVHTFRRLSVSFTSFGTTTTTPKKYPPSSTLRRAVFERDAYRCQHCGDWRDLTADHIIPEAQGGPTTLDNLQCLCRSCNSRKGTRV